jgi:glutamyl-tRNA reductase
MKGVQIMDLDFIRVNAPQEHSQSILAAQDIVAAAVADFEVEQAARTVDPVIAALRAHVGVWVTEEVERVRGRSGDEAAEEVSRSLQRVTNALLHTPTMNAKSSAVAGNQAEYLKAVKTLFGIDLSQFEGDGSAAAALQRGRKHD